MLLRLVHGRWPVPAPPATALEAFHRDLVKEYDTWLRDVRGLHVQTRTKRTTHALRFLLSLGPCADQENLAGLSVRDVDAYLKQRCAGLRRASIEDCTVCLRDFLRHLHRSGRTASDLSHTVIGPRIYEHEDIPSALRPEEVQRVLEVTREDPRPVGLRDYAILTLLASYGLRATEIVRLRLEDIDWKGYPSRAPLEDGNVLGASLAARARRSRASIPAESAPPKPVSRSVPAHPSTASSVQKRFDPQLCNERPFARRRNYP